MIKLLSEQMSQSHVFSSMCQPKGEKTYDISLVLYTFQTENICVAQTGAPDEANTSI